MAAVLTVQDLIVQHSTNPVKETGLTTASNKKWLSKHPELSNFNQHCQRDQNGVIWADFDNALLPLMGDDQVRLATPVFPPNERTWRLASETDAANWFHHEVSNVVLPAFRHYPSINQVAESKALGDKPVEEVVDVMYTVGKAGKKQPVLVVEMKRCLVNIQYWMTGKGDKVTQTRLGQELRGYAFRYECPQIICFDGAHMLMLQFRAGTHQDINSPACAIDCWIIPRENPDGTALRLAFYRFVVQGLRRCQGSRALPFSLDSIRPSSINCFSGLPVWNLKGQMDWSVPPPGWTRYLNVPNGAFYYLQNNIDGVPVWETDKLWEPLEQTGETVGYNPGGARGHQGDALVDEDTSDLYD